jgi:hypothetical protein
MIQLDQAAETTGTPPDAMSFTPKGGTTVIILERDGSLRHYPPGSEGAARSANRPPAHGRQAQIQLREEQAQPKLIDKLLDFTFDVLGVTNLEVRINEHPKR